MKDVGQLTFRFISFVANAVPGPVRRAIVELCAVSFCAFSPRKRRNVRLNIAATGRHASRSAVYGIFRLHTTNIVEMFAASRWRDDSLRDWFEFEGRGDLDRALVEGRGVVLVTGHFGSWELCAIYLRSLGYRLSVVAGIQMNRLLTGALKEAKEKRGIVVINPNDSGRSYLKALQSNGILVLLVDGNIYTGGVSWPLFGKPARLPDGPIRLAKAAGAPILGGYCRRVGDTRCAIHIERILGSHELETQSESEALARTYGTIERFIGENVDQWCIFRRIWGD